jgi:hypothetical protein
LVICLALAPLLAGCGVPDLVAHTVKAVEKSQNGPSAASAAAPSTQPQPAVAAPAPIEDYSPPPAAYYPPSRPSGGVTVEELPPR